MNFFERYLTVWVAICMVLGVLIGQFLPEIPTFLSQVGSSQCINTCGDTYLANDLSNDDEGRFS